MGYSCVLDSRGDLVCTIVPDFSKCVGSSHCLVAGVSAELWKWHRRLGHLSFDLLSRLSGLGLVRGFPKLKYQKDLVCASCRHGKMVAASHPPPTSVMIERPCELFHMDLVGPAHVCSAGGKCYALLIVDDYSRYAWVFFLADKGETQDPVPNMATSRLDPSQIQMSPPCQPKRRPKHRENIHPQSQGHTISHPPNTHELDQPSPYGTARMSSLS
jgi:hypothetical protein